jgi:predicted ATPase
MKIESIKILNYKALQNVEIKNISNLAVFLGENGVGKSTLFDVFGFLKDCLTNNVSSALQARGGYNEARSRDSAGDIEILVKYRIDEKSPLCSYNLTIGLDDDKNSPLVKKELLICKIADGDFAPFIDFELGKGRALADGALGLKNMAQAEIESFDLASNDILAIKSLGQMKRFKAAMEIRSFIEDWFVSDFQINLTRRMQDASYNEKLNRCGDNLANVTQFLHDKYPNKFKEVLDKMKTKIEGLDNVEVKTAEDGRILLKFSDGRFKDPFSIRFVSDGTIKLFTYLIMLADNRPHQFVCIEEPENQLYPHLLEILVEEFRDYALRGGQIFISTHSPDLVNALNPNELFVIKKQKTGYSKIECVNDDEQTVRFFQQGDKLGYLWKQKII